VEKHRKQGQNIFFIAVLALSIGFLAGFILIAISMILVRGYPGLVSSIGSKEIQFAIKLSFETSIISTLLCILVAVPVSYGMARLNFPGKRFINTIMDIPIALPPIVSGVALLLLFGTTSFGHALANRGIEFVFTPMGIVLAQFFVNVPYMIKVLESTIDDVDPRLEFVARTLGCSRLQSFFKITLPLARNGLMAGIVITWARALGEFGAALMLAGATRLKTETLPVSLFLNMSCGDLKLGLAAASVLIIISVMSLFAFEIMGGRQFELSRHGI
jgi:molybdate transport system permease protein